MYKLLKREAECIKGDEHFDLYLFETAQKLRNKLCAKICLGKKWTLGDSIPHVFYLVIIVIERKAETYWKISLKQTVAEQKLKVKFYKFLNCEWQKTLVMFLWCFILEI